MVNTNLIEAYKNLNLFKCFEEIYDISKKRTIIFLCVGNSKIWYDSFGPVLGSLLKTLDFGYYIYGNMKTNITLKNLHEYIDVIYKFHNNPYIVVVDSAISQEQKPFIKIKKESTVCGVLNKDNIEVGDLSILYCLNKKSIKDCNNYYEMIKEIKKIARMLLFVLNKNVKM